MKKLFSVCVHFVVEAESPDEATNLVDMAIEIDEAGPVCQADFNDVAEIEQ